MAQERAVTDLSWRRIAVRTRCGHSRKSGFLVVVLIVVIVSVVVALLVWTGHGRSSRGRDHAGTQPDGISCADSAPFSGCPVRPVSVAASPTSWSTLSSSCRYSTNFSRPSFESLQRV